MTQGIPVTDLSATYRAAVIHATILNVTSAAALFAGRWRWTFGRDGVTVRVCGKFRKIATCACAARVDETALMLPTAAHRAGGAEL